LLAPSIRQRAAIGAHVARGADNAAALAAIAATPPQQAYWAQHQEVDYLDNLPHIDACDALYYKYRDVLLRRQDRRSNYSAPPRS
jgi:hypothetical protein